MTNVNTDIFLYVYICNASLFTGFMITFFIVFKSNPPGFILSRLKQDIRNQAIRYHEILKSRNIVYNIFYGRIF